MMDLTKFSECFWLPCFPILNVITFVKRLIESNQLNTHTIALMLDLNSIFSAAIFFGMTVADSSQGTLLKCILYFSTYIFMTQ